MASKCKPKTDAYAPDQTVTEEQTATVADQAPVRSPRPASKLAQVLELLERKDGATIAEIAEVTGWQAHTVRGAFSGMITKKLGRTLTSAKIDGRGRVYRAELSTA